MYVIYKKHEKTLVSYGGWGVFFWRFCQLFFSTSCVSVLMDGLHYKLIQSILKLKLII